MPRLDRPEQSSHLPREVYGACLAAPLVIQPIVDAEFFADPALQTLREIAGNYVPALAIVAALWLAGHLPISRFAPGLKRPAGLLALQLAVYAVAAAAASAAVHPLHMALVTDADPPLLVYLQRNIGVTCLLLLPALALEQGRARTLAAERLLAEQQQAALWAQIESLKARTQPHFLFNVLNTLSSLIRDDAELAERTVHRLADILRFAIESTREQTIPLARELEVVEAYLEIERARFGERLRFELAVDGELRGVHVAPFLLHPLIENAVLHGMSARRRGITLCVSAAQRDGALALRVEDDGPGPGGSTRRGSGTSLADLEQRVALLYGAAGALRTERNAAGGFTAELTIPLARPA